VVSVLGIDLAVALAVISRKTHKTLPSGCVVFRIVDTVCHLYEPPLARQVALAVVSLQVARLAAAEQPASQAVSYRASSSSWE
jgi:hypothetical protein